MNYDGITVFTDGFILDPIVDQVDSKIKVAWMMEPPDIHPWLYEKIFEVEDKFDYILTFEKTLLARSPKYVKYIVGQSRITNEVANFYEKSKGVSMIYSGKAMSNGHRYRKEIIQKLHSKHKFDLWGYGANAPFNEKTEPLIDYEFSICIQNCKIDHYFTEILLDCFRLGTIPIFWGCPNIEEYFDVRGMETFDTIEELDYILSNPKPYKEYLKYAKNNFFACKEFLNTDDYIAKILEKILIKTI
jgi:hypothetical protein